MIRIAIIQIPAIPIPFLTAVIADRNGAVIVPIIFDCGEIAPPITLKIIETAKSDNKIVKIILNCLLRKKKRIYFLLFLKLYLNLLPLRKV